MGLDTRVTVDMTPDEYMYLKMACAMLGVSMREFISKSAFQSIEDLEDEWLAEKARSTLRDIESGKEKTISWTEMKKRIK